MSEKLREVEVFVPEKKEWKRVRLIEVKKGQLFRMWDFPPGNSEYADQLVTYQGRTEFFASRDAFLNEQGVATVLVD